MLPVPSRTIRSNTANRVKALLMPKHILCNHARSAVHVNVQRLLGTGTVQRDERPAEGQVWRMLRPSWPALGVAAVAGALNLVLIYLLPPAATTATLFILFLLAVTIGALYGGLIPGIMTTLLCTVLSACFLFIPSYSYETTSPWFIVPIALLFGTGLLISKLMEQPRRARRRAEEAYQEAQATVLDQRHFLSLAVHELKTPLTTILTCTQELQRHGGMDGQRNEWMQQLLDIQVSQAWYLNRLLDSLFDLAGLEMGNLTVEHQLVDLCTLLHQVVKAVQVTVAGHILELDCPAEQVFVEGDDLRLQEVLHNLLSNAIKYSPEGSIIKVQLVCAEQYVSIMVSDQGIGIPAAAKEHLFQRFYRATNAGKRTKGLGIGLYIVNEIVTRHNGFVEVTSAQGSGSTFTVRLPILPNVSAANSRLPMGTGDTF